MNTLAAGPASDVLGAVGYGGLSLFLSTVLYLACKKNKFHPRVVLVVAFLAGSCFLHATGIWGIPQRATMLGMTLLGVGQGGNAALGDVGPGAVALMMVAIALWADLGRKGNAILGIGAATVFAGAGGAWVYFTELGSSFSSQVA